MLIVRSRVVTAVVWFFSENTERQVLCRDLRGIFVFGLQQGVSVWESVAGGLGSGFFIFWGGVESGKMWIHFAFGGAVLVFFLIIGDFGVFCNNWFCGGL